MSISRIKEKINDAIINATNTVNNEDKNDVNYKKMFQDFLHASLEITLEKSTFIIKEQEYKEDNTLNLDEIINDSEIRTLKNWLNANFSFKPHGDDTIATGNSATLHCNELAHRTWEAAVRNIPDEVYKRVINIKFRNTGFELKNNAMESLVAILKTCTSVHAPNWDLYTDIQTDILHLINQNESLEETPNREKYEYILKEASLYDALQTARAKRLSTKLAEEIRSTLNNEYKLDPHLRIQSFEDEDKLCSALLLVNKLSENKKNEFKEQMLNVFHNENFNPLPPNEVKDNNEDDASIIVINELLVVAHVEYKTQTDNYLKNKLTPLAAELKEVSSVISLDSLTPDTPTSNIDAIASMKEYLRGDNKATFTADLKAVIMSEKKPDIDDPNNRGLVSNENIAVLERLNFQYNATALIDKLKTYLESQFPGLNMPAALFTYLKENPNAMNELSIMIEKHGLTDTFQMITIIEESPASPEDEYDNLIPLLNMIHTQFINLTDDYVTNAITTAQNELRTHGNPPVNAPIPKINLSNIGNTPEKRLELKNVIKENKINDVVAALKNAITYTDRSENFTEIKIPETKLGDQKDHPLITTLTEPDFQIANREYKAARAVNQLMEELLAKTIPPITGFDTQLKDALSADENAARVELRKLLLTNPNFDTGQKLSNKLLSYIESKGDAKLIASTTPAALDDLTHIPAILAVINTLRRQYISLKTTATADLRVGGNLANLNSLTSKIIEKGQITDNTLLPGYEFILPADNKQINEDLEELLKIFNPGRTKAIDVVKNEIIDIISTIVTANPPKTDAQAQALFHSDPSFLIAELHKQNAAFNAAKEIQTILVGVPNPPRIPEVKALLAEKLGLDDTTPPRRFFSELEGNLVLINSLRDGKDGPLYPDPAPITLLTNLQTLIKNSTPLTLDGVRAKLPAADEDLVERLNTVRHRYYIAHYKGEIEKIRNELADASDDKIQATISKLENGTTLVKPTALAATAAGIKENLNLLETINTAITGEHKTAAGADDLIIRVAEQKTALQNADKTIGPAYKKYTEYKNLIDNNKALEAKGLKDMTVEDLEANAAGIATKLKPQLANLPNIEHALSEDIRVEGVRAELEENKKALNEARARLERVTDLDIPQIVTSVESKLPNPTTADLKPDPSWSYQIHQLYEVYAYFKEITEKTKGTPKDSPEYLALEKALEETTPGNDKINERINSIYKYLSKIATPPAGISIEEGKLYRETAGGIPKPVSQLAPGEHFSIKRDTFIDRTKNRFTDNSKLISYLEKTAANLTLLHKEMETVYGQHPRKAEQTHKISAFGNETVEFKTFEKFQDFAKKAAEINLKTESDIKDEARAGSYGTEKLVSLETIDKSRIPAKGQDYDKWGGSPDPSKLAGNNTATVTYYHNTCKGGNKRHEDGILSFDPKLSDHNLMAEILFDAIRDKDGASITKAECLALMKGADVSSSFDKTENLRVLVDHITIKNGYTLPKYKSTFSSTDKYVKALSKALDKKRCDTREVDGIGIDYAQEKIREWRDKECLMPRKEFSEIAKAYVEEKMRQMVNKECPEPVTLWANHKIIMQAMQLTIAHYPEADRKKFIIQCPKEFNITQDQWMKAKTEEPYKTQYMPESVKVAEAIEIMDKRSTNDYLKLR